MGTPISKIIPGTRTFAPGIEVGERGTITNNNSAHLIYQVTEGRKLKLANLIVTNFSANATVALYDNSSTLSNRIIELIIGAEKTEILGPEDLIGAKEAISGVVVASSISGVIVHVGGYEY